MADEPTRADLHTFEGHTAEDLGIDKAETVCKFCGVSYLIFSEVKALEKKLENANKKIASLQKKIEQEKSKSKESLTSVQVDALEAKQQFEAQIIQLKEQHSNLNQKLKAIEESRTVAIETAVTQQAAKLQTAVAEATEYSQKQLQAQIAQKAVYHNCLLELPKYLSSLRQLKHDRDHLSSLTTDLKQVVELKVETIGKGIQRLAKAVKKSQSEIDKARRELNSQLSQEVEKLNAKYVDQGKSIKDLENQVKILQNKLVVERKEAIQKIDAADKSKNDEWEQRLFAAQEAANRVEVAAKHNDEEKAKIITFLQSELSTISTTVQETQASFNHNSQQLVQVEGELASLRTQQESLVTQLRQACSERDGFQEKLEKINKLKEKEILELQEKLSTTQNSHTKRETQLVETAQATNMRATFLAKKLKVLEIQAADAAKAHSLEISNLKSNEEEARIGRENEITQKFTVEIARLERKCASLESQLAETTQRNKEMQTSSLQELEEITKQLQDEHGKAFTKVQLDAEKEVKKMQQQLTNARLESRNAITNANDIQSKLQRAESISRELRQQLSHLEHKLEQQNGAVSSAKVGQLEHCVKNLQTSLKQKDDEICRLENMVHRECLERTDLLARIRELERA